MTSQNRMPAEAKRRMAIERRARVAARTAGTSSEKPVSANGRLIEIARCVEIAAEAGLTFLTAGWFAKQMERRKLPHTVISRRRVMDEGLLLAMIDGWRHKALVGLG